MIDGDMEIGKVLIEKMKTYGELADYSVRFAVERGGRHVGLHQRMVEGFPRTHYNVLGLLALALQTLSPEELSLEPGTEASDLAWRQRGSRLSLSR